jgi:hypothetical protein
MNTPTSIPTPTGADGLVHGLIRTLRQEEAELVRLAAQFERQLDALRDQRQDEHEQALHEASETLGILGQLRVQRERQMRLLSRVFRVDEDATIQHLAAAVDRHPGTGPWGADLLEARAAVCEQAAAARRICEQLDFALQYAVSLGREMVQAIQDLDGPSPCVYTATGHTSRAAMPRSLVNKVG